jgi:hypothetical protein
MIVYDFSAEEIGAVQNLNIERDLQSFKDNSVIMELLQLNFPMLTGDQKMRVAAE